MEAALPEAPSFAENGRNGRVGPECGLVERGASLVLSGSLFNTFSFRGFSLLCSLRVFLDEWVGVD